MAAICLRREHCLGRGDSLDWVPELCTEQSLGLRRGEVTVLVVFDGPALPLPAGAEVLLASGPLADDGAVPSDTTVWLRTA